jgi:hypothetical protein
LSYIDLRVWILRLPQFLDLATPHLKVLLDKISLLLPMCPKPRTFGFKSAISTKVFFFSSLGGAAASLAAFLAAASRFFLRLLTGRLVSYAKYN